MENTVYRIVPQADPTYSVVIERLGFLPQGVHGFSTERLAEAWIEHGERGRSEAMHNVVNFGREGETGTLMVETAAGAILREKAERCRCLAGSMVNQNDPAVSELLAMADELEAMASSVDRPANDNS